MTGRTLPPEVVVLPGTDVDAAWDRFEVFEALHHGMQICNPMTDADLDRLLEHVEPGNGDRMLDIACGHGELLIRAATRAAVRGVGVDLSPWVIARSSAAARRTPLLGTLEWRLGDARDLRTDESFDVVTCLGASWIWHGFEGTVRAMVARAGAGARVAIGDLRLRDDVDAAHITATYGKVPTADEQAAALARAGVTVVNRSDASDAGWDGYQDRIDASARTWAIDHPGQAAERYLEEQESWRREHEVDRKFLDWTVWAGVVTQDSR